jgi:hypothetical protein
LHLWGLAGEIAADKEKQMTRTSLMIALTAFGAGAAAVPLVSGIVNAATDSVPDVLRAHSIELLDAGGKQRARLGIEDNGTVVFRLIAANGDIRVKLAADDGGSGFLLLDDGTEPGVHMLADDSGGSFKLNGVAE